MPKLDLNAKRAERAAKRGEAFSLEVGDPPQQFDLVSELPMAIAETTDATKMGDVVRLILANPDADLDRFFGVTPPITLNDVMEIVASYGVTLGESAASITSSMSTGARSGPTSSGSTTSTSPSVVGDNDVSASVG